MRLWFDLDGVLADFDKRAEECLGVENSYKFEYVYGADVFWKRIHDVDPFFFRNMPMMPGAQTLLDATRHLDRGVLTAIPKTNGASADYQKREWCAEHAPFIPVTTCYTKDKPKFCAQGDVMIDDRALNRAEWIKRGGRYIVHESVEGTMTQLSNLGLLQ